MTSLQNMEEDLQINLDQAIQEYRENREDLINIQSQTKEAFIQITNILKPSTAELLECVNVDSLSEAVRDLGLDEEKPTNYINNYDTVDKTKCEDACDGKKIEIGNPAIAIVGQVKAGKSAFVNSLLKKNVVCQGYERCTARLTRLTYNEVEFVELRDIDGTVSKRKLLKRSKIPAHYLKLKERSRNDLLTIQKEVIAGINSQFLKNGIDIIDTPGLSEIPILSNLSKGMVKNVLPVMVYVIDGRTSVKQTDISDIVELKNAVSNLQIIYFITKLDTDDVDETPTNDVIELAKAKMDMAFKKLQYNNLIPSTYNHWSECNYFHGASLYAYMDYHSNVRTPETLFHFQQFSKFESALGLFLMRNFENKIVDASETMINFQMYVITKIINRAKSLTDFSKNNMAQITKIGKLEEYIFDKIKSVALNTKTSLINRLVQRVKDESSSILNPIADMEYPSSIMVPESGMVIGTIMIEKCQRFIIDVICLGMENIIKQFVQEELFTNYRREIEKQIGDQMGNEINIFKENENKSIYWLCLKRILLESYTFNITSNLTNSQSKNRMIKVIDIILNSVKKVFWKIFRIEKIKGCVDVKSASWKIHQAKKCLAKCDFNQLAKEVSKDLIDELEIRHNNFVVALEAEKTFTTKTILISEVIRKEIANKTPDFAYLLMLTLDIKSRYMLLGMEENEQIGQGSQYVVYRCTCKGKELAKKTCQLKKEQLNTVAEEVYYSYLFEHPRLLPFIAISISPLYFNNYKQISIFIPLMKTDVLNYLSHSQTTFKERLKIGLQVAEALQYLHHQQIMHRDLKLGNILLDDKNNVYLADYGFCKSPVLSQNSLVGTPIHMAPEIIKNQSYDFKVDIYSFGVLLWYLAEGKGNHPTYAGVQTEFYAIVWNAVEHDRRPERLSNMSDELWNLVCICWDKNPSSRPNIDIVIKNLLRIINNHKEDYE